MIAAAASLCEIPVNLEWLDDRQNDDGDQEDGRYLVDHAIEFRGVPVPVGGKILAVAGQQAMQRAQQQHQNNLQVQPSRRQKRVLTHQPDQGKAEQPSRDHRRIDDRPEQSALHHLERFRLFRARLGFAVIDEQPRQIEHPGHPGDDRDDVEGFDPKVHALRLIPPP